MVKILSNNLNILNDILKDKKKYENIALDFTNKLYEVVNQITIKDIERIAIGIEAGLKQITFDSYQKDEIQYEKSKLFIKIINQYIDEFIKKLDEDRKNIL